MKPGDYLVRIAGGTMRVTLTSVDPRKNLAYVHCERPEFHDFWVPEAIRRHRTLYIQAFQSCIVTDPETRRAD